MCLVHNVKKIVKKVLGGIVHLPGKHSKPIEMAMLECREEQLTWPVHHCTISPGSEQKRLKGGDSLQGITVKVLETIDGW